MATQAPGCNATAATIIALQVAPATLGNESCLVALPQRLSAFALRRWLGQSRTTVLEVEFDSHLFASRKGDVPPDGSTVDGPG